MSLNNENESSDNGLKLNPNKTKLIGCDRTVVGEIMIPATVTSINQDAFKRCTGLTSVEIPTSVTSDWTACV